MNVLKYVNILSKELDCFHFLMTFRINWMLNFIEYHI